WADRYGFRVADTLLGSLSTETGDPDAGRLARIADEARAAGVRAVFAENVGDPRLAQALARAGDVKAAPRLYTDALGPPGGPGETYLKMMRFNADAIVKALSGEAP